MSKLKECDKVRVLNDNFRTTFIGGQVLLSYGVSELPIDIKARALLLVKNFKDFSNDNDPYGEHDFGFFDLATIRSTGRSTTTTPIAGMARKIPAIPRKRRVCSPSCSRRSIEPCSQMASVCISWPSTRSNTKRTDGISGAARGTATRRI